MKGKELHAFLDGLVEQHNHPDFIQSDPILIPHRFTDPRDIEISGLIAATFAWGQRVTIINKATDFIDRMDNDPAGFVQSFKPSDLKAFLSFKHRTFNGDDALSLLYFLQDIYQNYDSLEAFFIKSKEDKIKHGLVQLNTHFRGLTSTLKRSHKHMSNPAKNSACKRLNMYLRWMVRKDEKGVDFGIWDKISMSDLIIPLDVHVIRAAMKLRLIKTEKANWKTAETLTQVLRKFDPLDPVKYDYALFNYSLSLSNR